MFDKYLVTGASGFLGRAVLAELKTKHANVSVLVMENDPLSDDLPLWVSKTYGDVCDDASLERFFAGSDSKTCVLHCAGIVSVATHPGERIYQVNADKNLYPYAHPFYHRSRFLFDRQIHLSRLFHNVFGHSDSSLHTCLHEDGLFHHVHAA